MKSTLNTPSAASPDLLSTSSSAPEAVETDKIATSSGEMKNTETQKLGDTDKTQTPPVEKTSSISTKTSTQKSAEMSTEKSKPSQHENASKQTTDKTPPTAAHDGKPTPSALKVATHTAVPPHAPQRATSTLATLALTLATITAICAVFVTVFLFQRLGQMEQQLHLAQQNSGNTAAEAKDLAQRAMNMSIESGGKLAYTHTQIEALKEQSGRLDMLMQYINNSKIETLPTDLRNTLQAAQLQTELTGSVEPLLITLKAMDERLMNDELLAQSPLRRAIAQDIESIRNMPTPDPMGMSSRINDLYQRVDTLPLVIDPPEPPAQTNMLLTTTTASSETPTADTPTEEGWRGSLERSWEWTSKKAHWLGTAVWGEMRTLVTITPIQNPEAALLSPDQGIILRENLKLNLLNLRMSIVQRQYAQAQSSAQEILGLLTRYFDQENKNVQDFINRLQTLQSGLNNVSLPSPNATLAALAAMTTAP